MARRTARSLLVGAIVIGLTCCGCPAPDPSPPSQGTPTATSPVPPVLVDVGG